MDISESKVPHWNSRSALLFGNDTLGSLLFVPEGKKYGECLNIFSEPFSSYLLELGF